jgi:hypothetical protein
MVPSRGIDDLALDPRMDLADGADPTFDVVVRS